MFSDQSFTLQLAAAAVVEEKADLESRCFQVVENPGIFSLNFHQVAFCEASRLLVDCAALQDSPAAGEGPRTVRCT